MTRESFVNICNKQLSNTLTQSDIVELLQAYCEEKCPQYGYEWKDIRDQIDLCIITLVQRNAWEPYYTKALNHFKTKHIVCCLQGPEKDVKTPLGVIRNREPLLYY